MRLGVYVDVVFKQEGGRLSADRAFVDFIAGLAPRLEELLFFGRLDPAPGRFPHLLPSERVRLAPLPYYRSAASPREVIRTMRGSLQAVERELGAVDGLWLFGPHPLALVFARAALKRGTPVILGVRQDLLRYAAARTSSVRRAWGLPAAVMLEAAFRRLARRTPSVVVGRALARKYAHGAPLLATGFSLVSERDLVPLQAALARRWTDELRLLTVGRLSPEKNPLLLPEILGKLRRFDSRWRLSVVGQGPLADRVSRRAMELGLADVFDLAGYVPSGPALWERYRSSHAFLHVSLTEGLPQVLFEAQAAGLPVVATDVGGVRDALHGGSSGLLVPPRDAAAAAAAVDRLRTDPALRRRLIESGARNAAAQTRETQLETIFNFLRSNIASRRARLEAGAKFGDKMPEGD